MSVGTGKHMRRWRNVGAIMGKRFRIDQELQKRFGKSAPDFKAAQNIAESDPVMTDEMALRHRCFMDGIDWQHHLDADIGGTLLFPDEASLREIKTCLSGGCGVVEVEVRLIRWVEPQDLKYRAAPVNAEER